MFQKNNLKKIALFALLAGSFAACKKDPAEPHDHDHDDAGKEFKYVRVLVSDETSSRLTQIDPFTAAVSGFDAKFPLANLYATASGRYAAVLYGANNLVEVFDNGLQSHDDHVDVAGNAKWASITASGLKPTHFKSDGAESIIFNDGDGTLSVGHEADFNQAGAKFKTINAGLLPHHGAMAQFSNGTYAVTRANTAGGSPTRVMVIGKTGAQVHASSLETGAIHGNATDGMNAVFGIFTNASNTAGGVLVVRQSGEQRIIPNPEGFGAFRLGTILYAKAAKKFIGYAATKGAYVIDLVNNSMTAIYSGSDAIQCKTDYAGKHLLVLTLDGQLKIYDLATGALKKQGKAIAATPAADTYKPVLEATGRFAYIAVPAAGEVHQVSLEDFSVIKHKVSARPVRLAVFGFESSASHDH